MCERIFHTSSCPRRFVQPYLYWNYADAQRIVYYYPCMYCSGTSLHNIGGCLISIAPPDSRRSPKCNHLFLLRFHCKHFLYDFLLFLQTDKKTDKHRSSLKLLGGGRVTDCAWPCSCACAHACGLGFEPAWSRPAIGWGRAWPFGVAVDSL